MIEEIIYSGLETVTLLVSLRILLKSEYVKTGWAEIFLVGASVVYFSILNYCGVSRMWACVVYIMPIVYAHKKLKASIGRVCIAFVLSGVALTILQAGNYFLVLWIFQEHISSLFVLATAAEILSLVEIWAVSRKLKNFDIVDVVVNNVWRLLWATVGLGAAVCFWIICLSKSDFPLTHMELALVFVLLIVTGILIWKAGKKNLELQQKKRELEIYEKYNHSYEELLTVVRKRQHEFRTHLTAMYACHYSAHSLEELKSLQKDYLSQVKEDNDLNGILYQMQIPVLSGFFYVKISEAKEAHISVDYRFCVTELLGMSAFEWVEIFGILLDNAIEAEKELPEQQRAIRICFSEAEDGYRCAVENRYRYVVTSELSAFFVENHSSKGEGRGLGLAKLKDIAEKYHGTIRMQCEERDETYWICSTVELQK